MRNSARDLTFFWLSMEENKRRLKFRETRYRHYASDYSLSIECMEMHTDVLRYNQETRMEGEYRRIHEQRVARTSAGAVGFSRCDYCLVPGVGFPKMGLLQELPNKNTGVHP